MKNAIGYIRISTQDQSRHSLEAQADGIRDYAKANGYNLVHIYKDDGQSAKNFDRKSWKELEKYVKANHADIDFLIVYKYDRFSRNLRDALDYIHKLEKTYKIDILSVYEAALCRGNDPMSKWMRTQVLLNSEFELDNIRMRREMGVYQGKKSGRYCGKPPIGYIGEKREDKHTYLVIDPVKSHYIKDIYDLYLSGTSIAEVYRILITNGFKQKGHSSIQRILQNPVYAGLIVVPKYQDNPERIIDGLHKPIIAKQDYYKVQAMLSGRDGKNHRKEYNKDVPLKGVLKHCCGEPLTAGNSKGKSGKYYWYYVCSKDRKHLSANKLHAQFDELLKHLSFSEAAITEIEQKLIYHIEQKTNANELKVKSLEKDREKVKKSIDNLELKYIEENTLSAEVYKKWMFRYQKELEKLNNDIKLMSGDFRAIWSKYKDRLLDMANLTSLYNRADVHQKHSFISMVFDNKLYHDGNTYRTPYLLSLFTPKALLLKEKRLLVYEQPFNDLDLSPACTTYGNRTRDSSVKGRRLNPLTNAAFPVLGLQR